MNLIEKATIIHYHRHRIQAYERGTVKALGWRGDDSQHKRFEVISTIGDFRECSLLDVGCGHGDLKGYLDTTISAFTYIGIDQMPEFIAVAQEQYRDSPNTFFYQADFTTVEFPQVDYVLASGALGYRCDNPDFYGQMIQKMYEAATKAAAFNMLDAAHFQDDQLLVGHDFDTIVALCKRLSHRIAVVRGYLDDDFTVFLYKDG